MLSVGQIDAFEQSIDGRSASRDLDEDDLAYHFWITIGVRRSYFL